MTALPASWADLPEAQRRIRVRSAHPARSFVEFTPERIDQPISACFEEQVRRSARHVAVRTRDRAVTYAELDAEANRIAHAVMDRFAGTNGPVGLLFGNGPAFVAASLGVLKAGRVQIALDPSLPGPRLDAMMAQSGCGVILTTGTHAALARRFAPLPVLDVDAVDARAREARPVSGVSPDAEVAVAYTSGSTGSPKGMVWSHRGVLHAIMRHTNASGLCPDDRLVMFRPSLRGYLYALLAGATFYPVDLRGEGAAGVADWMAREDVTVYRSPVSTFRAFAGPLSGAEEFPRLRLIILLGEPVYRTDVDLYRARFRSGAALASSLGCSEFDDYAYFCLDRESAVGAGALPGGYASRDADVLLLGEDGRPVPEGAIGEIAIRSRYNIVGYWRRPDLTRAAFLPDPGGAGVPVYRTGDLGRREPDGCLVHLGRTDFQVKIRGHRVEVAEVEAALRDVPHVADAVVVGREDTPGDKRLVAYVTAAGERAPTAGELRGGVAGTLPDYMVPSAYVVLDALPRTATGKVDRRALPAPSSARPGVETPFAAPRTPLEERLCALWADVLALDRVGVHDNFLELGGDSLRATSVLARVLAELETPVSAEAVLSAPTVAEMAAVILQAQAAGQEPSALDRMLTDLEARSGTTDG